MPIELPWMDPCYFCALLVGAEHRWRVVDESDLVVSVLNGRQFETGQCIVVPRRHAPTLLDLTEPESHAVMAAARRLMQAMIDAFDPDGVLIYQNNGVGSGQEVPHFHLHVVPRRAGSDWGAGPPHLARVESGPRPAHLDFSVVTAEKQRTADVLRRHSATLGARRES